MPMQNGKSGLGFEKGEGCAEGRQKGKGKRDSEERERAAGSRPEDGRADVRARALIALMHDDAMLWLVERSRL